MVRRRREELSRLIPEAKQLKRSRWSSLTQNDDFGRWGFSSWSTTWVDTVICNFLNIFQNKASIRINQLPFVEGQLMRFCFSCTKLVELFRQNIKHSKHMSSGKKNAFQSQIQEQVFLRRTSQHTFEPVSFWRRAVEYKCLACDSFQFFLLSCFKWCHEWNEEQVTRADVNQMPVNNIKR